MIPKVSSCKRKSSINELKVAIKKVKINQYEKKVKNLQQSRNSRSPSVTKKHHSKSRSVLIEPSMNNIYSKPEISKTNSEYGLKSPDIYYLEEDLKSLRSENFDLKKKLSSIKKDYDMLIIQIRKQLESEKKAEISKITKFYMDKIAVCEENFELKISEKVNYETAKVREETRKVYENQIKDLIAGRFLSNNSVHEQFYRSSKDSPPNPEKKSNTDNNFDMEYKLKLILDTKTSEFDRKLGASTQENIKLRKENENLKQRTIELQAKLETFNLVNIDKDFGGPKGIVSKYNELLNEYNSLKAEKEYKETVCVKCRAVLNTNNELSKKILRLREFLSN